MTNKTNNKNLNDMVDIALKHYPDVKLYRYVGDLHFGFYYNQFKNKIKEIFQPKMDKKQLIGPSKFKEIEKLMFIKKTLDGKSNNEKNDILNLAELLIDTKNLKKIIDERLKLFEYLYKIRDKKHDVFLKKRKARIQQLNGNYNKTLHTVKTNDILRAIVHPLSANQLRANKGKNRILNTPTLSNIPEVSKNSSPNGKNKTVASARLKQRIASRSSNTPATPKTATKPTTPKTSNTPKTPKTANNSAK